MNTIPHAQAEVDGETLGEQHAKKKAVTQENILAGNVVEWQVNSFGDLLSVVKPDG